MTPNKRLRYFIIYTLLLTGCTDSASVSAPDSADKDSVYTLENVYDLAGRQGMPPEGVLDSIEWREAASDYKRTPRYMIEYAKADIASRQLDPQQTLQILHKLFPSPEIERDDEAYIKITGLLSNEYIVLNRRDDAVKYALLNLERAQAINQPVTYAKQLVNFWGFFYDSNNPNEGVGKIREARRLMQEHPDACDSTDIIWSLEMESRIQSDNEKMTEAIRLEEEILNIYEHITPEARKNTALEADANLRFKQAQTHATLALYYALDGEDASAAKHYAQVDGLLEGQSNVISPQLYTTQLKYLKQAGRMREALDCALEYKNHLAEAIDSVNVYTYNANHNLSGIYATLGDYRQAWQYERTASELADSLDRRANQRTATELTRIYHTAEQQEQLIGQQKILIRNRFWIGLLVAWGGGFFIAISLIILYLTRHIRRKNRTLPSQIQTLNRTQRELERGHSLVRTNNIKSKSTAKNDLFDAISQLMSEKQSYLNPDLTREQIAAELNTNKLYVANAIQKHQSQTFGEYVNELRLEHACNLLMHEHDTKIEAIAAMSGFNSVRTFYRLFQKTHLLTPSEFRNTVIQNHHQTY